MKFTELPTSDGEVFEFELSDEEKEILLKARTLLMDIDKELEARKVYNLSVCNPDSPLNYAWLQTTDLEEMSELLLTLTEVNSADL